MMMKRFIILLKGIGLIDAMVFCCFIANFLMISSAEETNSVTRYDYEQFEDFLGINSIDDSDPFLHDITVKWEYTNCDISVLLQTFPNYQSKIDFGQNSTMLNGCSYMYELEDDRYLFIIVSDRTIRYVCRLERRCGRTDISNITIGETQASEVLNIDQNACFNPFIQWGPVSYHYLNDESFLQVTYKQIYNNDDSYQFVVDSIKEISRDECKSSLKYIHFCDAIK